MDADIWNIKILFLFQLPRHLQRRSSDRRRQRRTMEVFRSSWFLQMERLSRRLGRIRSSARKKTSSRDTRMQNSDNDCSSYWKPTTKTNWKTLPSWTTLSTRNKCRGLSDLPTINGQWACYEWGGVSKKTMKKGRSVCWGWGAIRTNGPWACWEWAVVSKIMTINGP